MDGWLDIPPSTSALVRARDWFCTYMYVPNRSIGSLIPYSVTSVQVRAWRPSVRIVHHLHDTEPNVADSIVGVSVSKPCVLQL